MSTNDISALAPEQRIDLLKRLALEVYKDHLTTVVVVVQPEIGLMLALGRNAERLGFDAGRVREEWKIDAGPVDYRFAKYR